MDLVEFLDKLRTEIIDLISEKETKSDEPYPYEELVFTEIVMNHMFENGIINEPEVCHFETKIGNSNLRISGFSVSTETNQIDLFVSAYSGANVVTKIPDADAKKEAEKTLRFLERCIDGKIFNVVNEREQIYELAITIKELYSNLDQIRIFVLTDNVANAKSFKSRDVNGKIIKLEVMDLERLYRHLSEGKPRDELAINFEEIAGQALPCVVIPRMDGLPSFILTAIPGETLRYIYEKFGVRILEANVRSFLSLNSKVNNGIYATLQDSPEYFMAYNNGIVLVVDDVRFSQTTTGLGGLAWAKGIQIVNGGQTTAAIYFSKRKNQNIDLGKVRIAAKIVVLNPDCANEEILISKISRYSNSQTAVKQSDLSANNPYHIELEKLSSTTYCPDGITRWFYERAEGSYKTLLAREGTTPAKLKRLKDNYSSARRVKKTDFPTYLHAWECKPYIVSLGAQKNFKEFMDCLQSDANESPIVLPTVQEYKKLIALTLLYRTTLNILKKVLPAFRANVVAYLIAVVSDKYSQNFDFEHIWKNQEISKGLQKQLVIWATEVNNVLYESAEGRMISEWAKKIECWNIVRKYEYSKIAGNIPEIRLNIL